MALGKHLITNHLAKPSEPYKIKYPAATEQEIIERFPAFLMPFFRKEGCRWQVLGTWYQSIKMTYGTTLHGWYSGVYRNVDHIEK